MENVYNEWNEAIEIAVNGKAIKNTYNGDGLRVKKEVDNKTTNYLYESTNVVLETDAQNNETAKNVYGNNLISRETNNETHTYMYNGHGDVTGITDEEGTIEGSYYYDAFGVMEEDTSEVDNPFTYSGYQYDEESELYYLNARYYDPEIARFLTEDTYRGDPNDPLSLNLYTYCENDPILATDPTGHWPSFLDKAVKSAKRVVNRVKKVAKKHVKRIVKKAARTVAKVAKQAKRKVYDGANYIRKKAQTVKKVVKRAYNRSRNYIVRKAKKAVRYARSAYRATKAMAKVVTRVTAKVAKKAASYVAKKASKAYKAVKSTVKSAAKTVANAVKNKVSALAKAASNVDWTRVAMGAAAIAGGIAIAALVIATAGTAAPLAGVAISLMLGSATVTAGASAAGTILIAGAAVAAGAYATSEVIEGVQDVGYGLSGSSQASYNPMRDEFFGGDQASYDIFGGIASAPFALVGSMGIAGKSALKSSNNQVYEGEAAGGHGNVKVGSDFGGVGIKQMPQNDVQKNYNKVMADSGNGGSGSGGQKLLSSEGNVGTYKDLVKSGSRGDNITPHHMPSAEYMKENFNISKNDGVSMNMEQPFPGAGGRHRLTRSYGSGTDLTETPRDSLARDIMDVRRIYQNDGLYTSTIRQSLQEVIAMNKRLFPEIFRKSRR